MDKQPYFPSLNGPVECAQCELRPTCMSADRFQRARRDFTHTSGRCPRLPNRKGFVAPDQQELYAATFPLVCAARMDGKLTLTLTQPGSKRKHRVYCSAGGFWYYKTKEPDEGTLKRIIKIHEARHKTEITDRMDSAHTNCCQFRCEVTDEYL